MNPLKPSAPDVARRTLAMLAALAPVLVVESFSRGIPWTVGLLAAALVAMALAWLAQLARSENRAHFPAQTDVVVIAALVALLLPAATAWTLVCLAVVIAVLVGRLAFGGLGQALFHPAMVGLATLALVFPNALDQAPWSTWAGPAIWLGVIILLLRGVVAWRSPVAFLLGATVATAWLPQAGLSPAMAALAVASHPAWLLCAFLIAGDSGTGCLRPRARLAYGLGCGLLVVTLDSWQAAAGLPTAMLLMNAVAPWLDDVLATPGRKVLSQ